MPTRRDEAGRWHVEVCVRRQRVHRRLPEGATASDARRLEAELRVALDHLKRPTVPGDPLLIDILADYAETHAASLRSPDTAEYHAVRIEPWCRGKRASQARQVAATFTDETLGAYAVGTINRSLGALKKGLRRAFERGETTTDYSATIKRLPEHNASTATLTFAQIAAIAEATDSDPTRAAIWIGLYTGMRRGEIVALRAEDIGEDMIKVRAKTTKTLKERAIPITPTLRPWLACVPLGIGAEGLKSCWQRARVKASLPAANFHDLRRSFATNLIRAKVPLHTVSKLLGHSSTAVTERVYAHLSGDQLRDAMMTLEDLHRGLHQPQPRRRASA